VLRRAPPNDVQGGVRGNAVQPGRKGCSPAKGAQRAVRFEEGLLRSIPGVFAVPGDAVGQLVDAILVNTDQLIECIGVPGLAALYEVTLVHR
jgi:hypothetical protein